MAPLSRQQILVLQLALVPIAALVASHIVFSQVLPGQPGYRFPWPYFLTVATVMLFCWEVNLFVFRWLDKRLPFWQNPMQRLVNQFLLGGVATLVTFAIVFPLAQLLYTHHWPATHTILRGVTVCITLASFVNGGYAGLYLLRAFSAERQKKLEVASPESLPNFINEKPALYSPSLVAVDVASGQLRIPIDQIAYFYSTSGLVLLVKTNGQQVSTRYSSFAQLAPGLDKQYFFQLSRQFLVGSGAVRAVQDDVNRKLIVTLVPALHQQQIHQEVIVSRYRSLELRKWLQTSVDH